MAYELFKSKAPWIMELLMRDFSISLQDSAAILGNLGHECGGFKLMQEQKPTVKGSKGGFGWAQWTGPRRRAFEAYCARNNLSPNDDKANYGWLFVELSTTEKGAIPAVKKATTIAGKVKAFEGAFERAGVKHYPSRNAYAAHALEAYAAAQGNITLPAWALPAKTVAPPPSPLERAEQPGKPPIPRPDDEPDPIAVQPPEPTPEPGAAPPAKRSLLAIIIEAILALFRKAPQ